MIVDVILVPDHRPAMLAKDLRHTEFELEAGLRDLFGVFI
jgi:hypothetical protein